uniref:Coenzyme F420-reducing hydrogenase alpha subunit-like protein n=1 Tax=Rhodopseudomonas palustris (strain BisA53) TaxID=316055 RepID=Q07S92_RHOP5
MNAAPRDDRIELTLALHEGRVASVGISARRPLGIGRLAEGRDGDAVAALVPQLFALCAQAQGAAIFTALAAARGDVIAPDRAAAQTGAVLAERLVELLRGTITSLAGPSLPCFVPALRQVIDASRRFDGVALPAVDAVAAIEAGLEALGLSAGCFDDDESYQRWLALSSPLAELHRPLVVDDSEFGAVALDPLAADDDALIGTALQRSGPHFASLPDLDGRLPETGALARNADHPLIAALGNGLGARLLARLIEIRATPALLRALLRGEAMPIDPISSRQIAPGIGLAAVECARGRLHHLVALDRQGLVSQFAILAPTEWNFHPRGPLFRALQNLALRDDDADRARVARLVAAFDPCVAFSVTIAEAADA